MSKREFLEVDPAKLHLPASRRDGADAVKLDRQVRRYGDSLSGMPTLEVSRGTDGELVINDCVTRAVRAAQHAPGSKVTVEVIDHLPVMVGDLPTVGETR